MWLKAHDVPAWIVKSDLGPSRASVIAVLPGRGNGRELLLCGHLDTYSWYPPLSSQEENVIRGPGAYDMKGGIAAIMGVMARLSPANRSGTITAIFVCDEEHSSSGIRHFIEELSADAAIVGEGTALRLGVSHHGRVRATITFADKAERDDLVWQLWVRSRVGEIAYQGLAFATPTTPSPSIVVQRNIKPNEDARLIGDRLRNDIDSMIDQRGYWDIRESFFIDEGHSLCALIRRHADNHGVNAIPHHLRGWTEAAVLAASGIPTVVFGPGGGGAHTVDEWVDIGQVEQAVEILYLVATDFCS
jgi:acetylornithine deacetylase